MYYTVYKITNLINSKYYIGVHKTSNLDDDYMGSGNLIIRAIKKYSIENFKKEYIKIFNNPEEMFNMESELVNEEFLNLPETYNLKVGGEGGAVNMKETDYYKSGRMADQNRKNYYLGTAPIKLIEFNKRKEEYSKAPTCCKNCNEPLIYSKRKNKFCSKSCSATFNNKGVNRHKNILKVVG